MEYVRVTVAEIAVEGSQTPRLIECVRDCVIGVVGERFHRAGQGSVRPARLLR